MIEKVSQYIEVFSLINKSDITPAIDAVVDGKITVMRVGSVYSFVFNPNNIDLAKRFVFLKERENWQTLSVVCTYEYAKQIVDKNRVNEDFFHMPADLCGKVIARIPIDETTARKFPYNSTKGTLQFIDFKEAHPIRSAFQKELAARGCEYLSITSGNIHGAPTIEDLDSAKKLAVLFNTKASFLGMTDTQTVLIDIPEDKGFHKGSYVILSFCDPNAIEVKRLANKTDRELTERHLKELFTNTKTQTPIEYALD